MSTFYKICTSNISFREYWWSARSPVVLIWWLIKLLRIPVPVSPDDPNVDSLQPFEIPEGVARWTAENPPHVIVHANNFMPCRSKCSIPSEPISPLLPVTRTFIRSSQFLAPSSEEYQQSNAFLTGPRQG